MEEFRFQIKSVCQASWPWFVCFVTVIVAVEQDWNLLVCFRGLPLYAAGNCVCALLPSLSPLDGSLPITDMPVSSLCALCPLAVCRHVQLALCRLHATLLGMCLACFECEGAGHIGVMPHFCIWALSLSGCLHANFRGGWRDCICMNVVDHVLRHTLKLAFPELDLCIDNVLHLLHGVSPDDLIDLYTSPRP